MDSALTDAPHGTASARLHAARARAIAMLGGCDEATTALDNSSYEFDVAGNDSLMDEIGGEFGFDRARHALGVGATYVLLGNATLAEAGAIRALKLLDARQPHERWNAGLLAARVDLGAARLLDGDLAGTEDALAPVFTLAPEWRTQALFSRIVKLGRMLHTAQYRRATEGSRICEAIEDFTANSLVARSARQTIASSR